MTDKNKRLHIAILGGSGFIGQAVISELLGRGHKITATYYKNSAANINIAELNWIAWDATQKILPDIDWQSVDAVLHLANYFDLHNFPDNAANIYKINIASTFNLLEKARLNNIKRLVISSTGAVMGESEIVSKENMNYSPINFYSSTKACAELLTDAYAGIVSAAVVRFYYPYGPGGERYLVGRLIEAVKTGKEINIEGEEGVLVNPTYLSDLANGVALLLESDSEGIFHLAGPEKISLRQLINLIGKLVGKQPSINSIPAKIPGGHAGSYKRSSQILGYCPQVSIETGLKQLIQ